MLGMMIYFHNAAFLMFSDRMALAISDRAIVLSLGAIQTQMSASALMNDADFRHAYLGG